MAAGDVVASAIATTNAQQRCWQSLGTDLGLGGLPKENAELQLYMREVALTSIWPTLGAQHGATRSQAKASTAQPC